MITVKEADSLIKENTRTFPVTEVNTTDSYGEILMEDIFADRELPPYNRVAMDGIAIDIKAWEKGRRDFIINGIQQAGSEPLSLNNADSCFEVMTGATLPENTNCVIRYEDLEIIDKNGIKEAKVNHDLSLSVMKNIHQKASDYKKGELIINKSSLLLPPQIALAISVGKARLKISKKPKIAIISTGDELVDIGQEIKPYQIRMSNSYGIYSVLKQLKYNELKIFHFIDNKKLLLNKLAEILETYDILILSGGVSMGKFDYIPSTLKELGVKEIFHKISQKPGKPLWFGKRDDNKIVFGLPGNPVSSMVCLYRYVLPFLKKSSGEEGNNFIIVKPDANIKVNAGITSFVPVKLDDCSKNSEMSVSQAKINGSGDFASLANTSGFIELDNNFEKGYVPFYSWKV